MGSLKMGELELLLEKEFLRKWIQERLENIRMP